MLYKEPRSPILYKEQDSLDNQHSSIDMMIELATPNTHLQQTHHPLPPPQQILLSDATNSSGGEDNNNNNNNSIRAPKRRAETWIQEETRALINLRREFDSLFNTSKSNKHLWDQISLKMREKGFDRSPTMCTDKWRNLLKEFKKVKQRDGFVRMTYLKEIEEILRARNKNGGGHKSPVLKDDAFMQFSEKGLDDTGITFGPVEENERPTLNLERQLDHDGHPLAITAADAVTASGVSPWNWRDTPANGEQSNSTEGRVISVKWGDYTKRIGIDGTANAIKEAIKSSFRLRTNRAFWLEDEENIVRTIDRDMPLKSYTLHVDEGLTIKVCVYEEADHLPVHTEDKTFYTTDDFRDFLSHRGWTCLREFNGYRNVDIMDELCPGAVYRGVNIG